jgi:hypothetical protein
MLCSFSMDGPGSGGGVPNAGAGRCEGWTWGLVQKRRIVLVQCLFREGSTGRV